MSTPAKLAGFGAAVAVTLVVSFGVGKAVGPVGSIGPADHGGQHGPEVTSTTNHDGGH